MDSELYNLANILNIDESQIVKWEGNTSVKFPDYFSDLKLEVHNHIIKILAKHGDSPYWKLDGKSLLLIFDEYTVVPSYRKVERQLGNCSYYHKRIRLNFGNPDFTKDQCRRTLVHEYVHAITKEFYNYSGHGELFMFYNNLLQMSFKKNYRQRNYDEIQKRLGC